MLGSTMDQKEFEALGPIRLKVVELILFIFKLHSDLLFEAIEESTMLQNISDIIVKYPWNNFLQLKVIALYEEIF